MVMDVTETERVPDPVLVGMMTLARTIVEGLGEAHQRGLTDLVHKTRVIERLVLDFLFRVPEEPGQGFGPGAPPHCKSAKSRTEAFSLLLVLVRVGEVSVLRAVVEQLRHVQQQVPFSLSLAKQRTKSIGYVGLVNLGTTCYLNSLIQMLFSIPEFRASILTRNVRITETDDDDAGSMSDESDDLDLRSPSPEPMDEKTEHEIKEGKDAAPPPQPAKESLLFQLQDLFANLQESNQTAFNTQHFCHSYKDETGTKPMNVGVQMDAEEFLAVFFDRLESALKGDSHAKILDHLFGGKLVNQLIGKECSHYSERREDFCRISVEVCHKTNTRRVAGSLVKGDMLDGDEQIHV
eukprot:GABV01000224.1.p1 GENE.GABV01000224.1~~GABV01000224.1.p1  ORF type:complete len:350 (+),score=104.17 GABV01000224.1:544-1593(+)